MVFVHAEQQPKYPCNFIYLFIIYNSKFEYDDEILKIIPSSRFNILVITIYC